MATPWRGKYSTCSRGTGGGPACPAVRILPLAAQKGTKEGCQKFRAKLLQCHLLSVNRDASNMTTHSARCNQCIAVQSKCLTQYCCCSGTAPLTVQQTRPSVDGSKRGVIHIVRKAQYMTPPTEHMNTCCALLVTSCQCRTGRTCSPPAQG